MAIGNIQADGGINPLKDQHVEQLKERTQKSESENKHIKDGADTVELSERARLMQEVEGYKKELENVPSANEGRIQELKESIANGSFLTEEALNETAQQLAAQLFV
jgi:anti-sigma28 factor (negative regulator of flagellin synthesis)